MPTLTGIERTANMLARKPADRICLYEAFWGDTRRVWQEQGHLRPDESMDDHFGFDLTTCWPFNCKADLDYTPQTIEEDQDTIVQKDGNYATFRRHKQHDTTPEHIAFDIQSRKEWEELIKPKLKAEPRRIDFQAYRQAKAHAARQQRFFLWSGVNVFEQIHPVCGHEYMLMGMAEDPDWVVDMVSTYAQLTIDLQEILFAAEGWPDGIWFYEDMGFKQRPFMSPGMYKELIQPAHKRTIDFAHAHQKPVVMHSCGFIEPLLPAMVEAGIDCLQVIEVKAGMDLLRIHKNFGDRLSLMGGIDVRALYSNDRQQVDRELLAKIPQVKQGYGYTLHSDHSIPNTVNYDTYRYFVQRGLELGQY
jgi:uroporphyrinogen decarboxylase